MSSHPRGPNRFNKREVERTLRAVRDSATPVERIDVDPATGKISVILSNAAQHEQATGEAEWDRATEQLTKQKTATTSKTEQKSKKVPKSAPTRR